jgi:hypothetical protein
MEYTDRVYGKVNIKEPVILELLNSAPLQRLKDVDQAGYRPLWSKPDVEVGKYDHSRYAHSVGVYLLLRKYNASLEEQISGLIHDVSHSAFSHCIDYVLDSGSEKEHNYQDNLFKDYVRNTEIPAILEKYGFDPEYILEEKNFPLKEKELPDLCADRIDYSLKTAVIFEELKEKEVNYFLDNLTVIDNNWVFEDLESAQRYAELFLKLNRDYYSGVASAIMFRAVGDCLRYALQKEYINESDLYTTDELVIKKLKKSLDKDENLQLFFDRMNKKVNIENDPDNYDIKVFCKSRVVNPLFRQGDKIKRVSQANARLRDLITQELNPKQYFLKFDK